MRTLMAITLVLVTAACGTPAKKPVTGATEGSDVAGDTCCCKSNPMSAEDGKPVYEIGNRMECSTKQGECVPDVQCEKQLQPE